MTFKLDLYAADEIHSPVDWHFYPMAHLLDERRRKPQLRRAFQPLQWVVAMRWMGRRKFRMQTRPIFRRRAVAADYVPSF